MRVIAGTAKSLRLRTLDGLDTRPTTDRIKETLFNIIGPSVYGCIFLDLFSGSGGIGIEALSRGAREAVFVENNPRAMGCIKDNLEFTHLASRASTMTSDVMQALCRLEGKKSSTLFSWIRPMTGSLKKKCWRICRNLSLYMTIRRSSSKHRGIQIFHMFRNTGLLWCGKNI